MKQTADNRTLELPMPGAKRGRGRPATGEAMTNAERQKAYRDRMRKNSGFQKMPTASVQAQAHQLGHDVEVRKTQIDKLRAEIEGLRSENALLVAERAAAFRAMNEATAELSEERKKIARKEDEVSRLKARNLELVNAYDRAHMKEVEYDNKFTPMKQQCGELFKQSNELMKQLKQQSEEAMTAKEKLRTSDTSLKKALSNVSRLEKQIEQTAVKKRNASRKKTADTAEAK